MKAAGVPIVPGMTTPAKDPAEIAAFGREHGFPLLLKAAAGGGGKGMRIVRAEEEVPAAFARARSEARSFFADEAVYCELYVEKPRHVEVQVLGDRTGRVVALGERECSLQRRHQKVLEECPSPVVSPELRAPDGRSRRRGGPLGRLRLGRDGRVPPRAATAGSSSSR